MIAALQVADIAGCEQYIAIADRDLAAKQPPAADLDAGALAAPGGSASWDGSTTRNG